MEEISRPATRIRKAGEDSDVTMVFVAFHIDGAEGAARTKILTCTAADALLRIDNRDLDALLRLDHRDGTCRAMTGAIAAFHAVGERYAIFLNPHGMANLHR